MARPTPDPSHEDMPRSWVFVLIMVLILQIAGCAEPAPYVPTDGVDVQHYDADLTIDPETLTMSGAATLSVSHPDTLEAITLAFGRGMRVDSVMVNDRRVEARHRRNLLEVPVFARTGGALSHIEVIYGGSPSEGVYAGTHEGHRVVYSDGWPDRVRGWLPGVHHPSDPATASMTLRHPVGHHVEASGRLVARDTLEELVHSQFELSAPVPTYSLAFAVGDYVEQSDTAYWNDHQWPVRFTLLDIDTSKTEFLDHVTSALQFFSQRVGPYPFEDYTTVQVPFRYAGMENAATSFVRADLFQNANPSIDNLGQLGAVAVHELAHQWFGNYISLADWRDLWLSEGMATYLTTLYVEHAEGAEAAHALRAELTRLDGSGHRWEGPLVPEGTVAPADHLSPVVYNRGAAVLHLLRLVTGDEAFFQGLRTVYHSYGNRPLSTKAFQQVMELQSGLDLQSFFDSWVYGTELPLLNTTWDEETRTLQWELEDGAPWIEESEIMLQIEHEGSRRYVALSDGEARLEGSEHAPTVTPVGVMIRVR